MAEILLSFIALVYGTICFQQGSYRLTQTVKMMFTCLKLTPFTTSKNCSKNTSYSSILLLMMKNLCIIRSYLRICKISIYAWSFDIGLLTLPIIDVISKKIQIESCTGLHRAYPLPPSLSLPLFSVFCSLIMHIEAACEFSKFFITALDVA